MECKCCVFRHAILAASLQVDTALEDKAMTSSSLETFINGVRTNWGPLTSELVVACAQRLRTLLEAPSSEDWLAALHRDAPANAELHRDPDCGFMLLAHTETGGLYRPPHDHGRGWVIYAVQHGAIEMGTYGRVEDADGSVRLVKRNATLVSAGQVQVYLPGDIHDTRCMTDSALLFRFTERDLRREDREHHRLTRYVECNGSWVPTHAPAAATNGAIGREGVLR
jgi:hypothetical protein